MTETREPVKIGDVLADTVGALYHEQMLREYVQAGEQVTLNAMVMLCLTAKAFDSTVKYVLLTDSDQGEWCEVAGLSANVPQYPGHFSTELDRDRDDLFDDEGWAASIKDDHDHLWAQYVVHTDLLGSNVGLLDVDRVLTEVHLPWRPVDGITRCRHCGEAVTMETIWPSGSRKWVTSHAAGRNFCSGAEGRDHEPFVKVGA